MPTIKSIPVRNPDPSFVLERAFLVTTSEGSCELHYGKYAGPDPYRWINGNTGQSFMHLGEAIADCVEEIAWYKRNRGRILGVR